MSSLIEIAKRCKEKREELGISKEELRNRTKIPIDVITKLEEDEEYLEKEPYARFLVKQIAISLDVEFDLKESLQSVEETPVKETKGFLHKVSRIFFLSSLLFVFFILSASFDRAQKSDKFYDFLSTSEIEEETETAVYESEDVYKPSYITLKASGNVLLTAYIDGKEKIIKLRKGENKEIHFENKIKIETVSNAKDLIIIFNNKPVKLSYSHKILHNIFIDADGIFLNGYNLAEKKES
ncbi:helix-turn-helix domain-containing protein [Persephonella sp.]